MLCTTVYARCPTDQVESVRSKLDAASSSRWDFHRHVKQTEAACVVQGETGRKLYLEGRRVPLYKDYNVRSRTIIEVGPTIAAFIEHVGLRVLSEEQEEGFAFAKAALEAYLYKTKDTQSWILECEVMHDSPQEAIALIESILLPLSLSPSPHKPQ